MYFPTQTFLVAGMSRSGIAAAEYLLGQHAAAVYLYDDLDDENVRAATERLVALGGRAVSGDDVFSCAAESDVLVLSPGITIDHPLPVAFRKAGKAIVGEAELGARALRVPAVAVTGTNGKTTTVSMIGHILRTAGKHAVTCGNFYGFLLAGGITLAFAVQCALNALVVSGCIPPTGLPLPLVSAGNTSLIVTMAGMGIVYGVSRHTQTKKLIQ